MLSKKPTNIDEYMINFPESTLLMMEQLRETIHKAAPEAEEVISYSMPAFKWNGILVYFAGYKNHIGFYPGSGAIKTYEKELTKFKTSKGAIQFPLDKPLPLGLVTKIVKLRIKQNKEKMKKK